MELERGQRLEYGGPLRRVRCQANGLAYASTLGSIAGGTATTECPPYRGAEWKHESPDFSRGENQLNASLSLNSLLDLSMDSKSSVVSKFASSSKALLLLSPLASE